MIDLPPNYIIIPYNPKFIIRKNWKILSFSGRWINCFVIVGGHMGPYSSYCKPEINCPEYLKPELNK